MRLQQLFGGNPIGVLVRLVVLSIVVGIVMSAMGIHPQELFYHIDRLVRRIYEMGFGAVEWVLQYFLIGAVVVVPIWLIARLFGLIGGARPNGRGRDGDA